MIAQMRWVIIQTGVPIFRGIPGELVDIMDVGFICAYLATPYARRVSGGTVYVDGGVNVMA